MKKNNQDLSPKQILADTSRRVRNDCIIFRIQKVLYYLMHISTYVVPIIFGFILIMVDHSTWPLFIMSIMYTIIMTTYTIPKFVENGLKRAEETHECVIDSLAVFLIESGIDCKEFFSDPDFKSFGISDQTVYSLSERVDEIKLLYALNQKADGGNNE